MSKSDRDVEHMQFLYRSVVFIWWTVLIGEDSENDIQWIPIKFT